MAKRRFKYSLIDSKIRFKLRMKASNEASKCPFYCAARKNMNDPNPLTIMSTRHACVPLSIREIARKQRALHLSYVYCVVIALSLICMRTRRFVSVIIAFEFNCLAMFSLISRCNATGRECAKSEARCRSKNPIKANCSAFSYSSLS